MVKPRSVEIIRQNVPQATIEELTDSYHVATLDNDADKIFAGSLDFIRTHASVPLQRD